MLAKTKKCLFCGIFHYLLRSYRKQTALKNILKLRNAFEDSEITDLVTLRWFRQPWAFEKSIECSILWRDSTAFFTRRIQRQVKNACINICY